MLLNILNLYLSSLFVLISSTFVYCIQIFTIPPLSWTSSRTTNLIREFLCGSWKSPWTFYSRHRFLRFSKIARQWISFDDVSQQYIFPSKFRITVLWWNFHLTSKRYMRFVAWYFLLWLIRFYNHTWFTLTPFQLFYAVVYIRLWKTESIDSELFKFPNFVIRHSVDVRSTNQ